MQVTSKYTPHHKNQDRRYPVNHSKLGFFFCFLQVATALPVAGPNNFIVYIAKLYTV